MTWCSTRSLRSAGCTFWKRSHRLVSPWSGSASSRPPSETTAGGRATWKTITRAPVAWASLQARRNASAAWAEKSVGTSILVIASMVLSLWYFPTFPRRLLPRRRRPRHGAGRQIQPLPAPVRERLQPDPPHDPGVVTMRRKRHVGGRPVQEVEPADVALALQVEAPDAVTRQPRQGVVAADEGAAHQLDQQFRAAVQAAVQA